MAAEQAVENHRDEWGLRYLQWEIYTLIPTWPHSQNSKAATDPDDKKIYPLAIYF